MHYKGNKHKIGVPKPKKLMKYLGKTQIEIILDRARNDNRRNYLILLTLWKTGMRNSELISLKKRDIKLERGEIIIHQGKGKKDRMIPLDPSLGDLLAYHMGDMALDAKLFPITSAQIRNITHKYQGEEDVHPHTFRHSFAVHCLLQGMNIRSLQKRYWDTVTSIQQPFTWI